MGNKLAMDAARSGKRGGAGRGQGRRPEDGKAARRRCQVMLDEGTIERATALGEGNLSAGLRLAVNQHGLSGSR